MLEKAKEVATLELARQKEISLTSMSKNLEREIQRLESLSLVNKNIRPEEIDYLKRDKEAQRQSIDNAGIRMDAIRVIVAA